MSPQKDNFDLLRSAMLALEHPVPIQDSLEIRIKKRRLQLESRGLPEPVIQETLNIEFIPGYAEHLIRVEAIKSKFSSGVESVEYREEK